MAHLEKHILSGKKMSKKQLKKEAKEELKEVAEHPERESKEAREAIKTKKKTEPIKDEKDNHEKHPMKIIKKKAVNIGRVHEGLGIKSIYFQPTMSKTLKLTIDEIRAVNPILRDFKGDLVELAAVIDDAKKLTITEEDWKAAKLVKTPTDDELRAQIEALAPEARKDFKAEQQLNWDPEWTKEVTLDTAVTSYIAAKIKEKADAKQITLQDQALITLNAKLQ